MPHHLETWAPLGDEVQIPRRPSSSSPGSSRRTADPATLSARDSERERRRHSSRMKAGPGSPKSPTSDSARQRARTSDGLGNRTRYQPLARKSEEGARENAASPLDAGVVDFSMDGMQLDVSMDDILDPSAAPRGRDSTAGQQAGANIAPWLMDDSTPLPSGSQTPAQGYDPTEADNGFAPKLNRLTSDRSIKTTYSARNGSQPSLMGMPSGQDTEQRSRQGSGDSIQTLAVAAPKSTKHAEVLPGGGRHSIAGRAGRFGSTASSASAGTAEKKKGGFLGGLLKRKGTGMSLGPSPLFLGPGYY